MRILFDQAVYEMRNKGNIAILQAAVNRIQKYWPEASVEIIASSRQLLRLYVPKSRPVNPYLGGMTKQRDRSKSLYNFIPVPALKLLFELREALRYQWKRFVLNQRIQSLNSWLRRSNKHRMLESGNHAIVGSNDKDNCSSFSEITNGVDLLVTTGGQYMSDPVKHLAFCVLERLDLAIRRGIPTVMVGQGFGPLEDPELIARAREILPRVDLILIREKKFAPALLSSLGVHPDKVFLTGDDAIEMAYEARSKRLGKDIGIGMRVAHYTEINEYHLNSIRLALSDAYKKYRARSIPIPISYSEYEFEIDDQVIRKLSSGRFNLWQGLNVFDSPLDLIKKVQKCRLVIAGAFHPAIFALAQGIPAVCLAKSNHYANKFIGLADLFGPGCQVIFLDDEHLKEKLVDAIASAWNSAELIRPRLLEAASRQIEWGHAGYQRIYELVSSKKFNAEAIGVR